MDIEGIAVSTIKYTFSTTNTLTAEVEDNDKTPSWDGFIYVYKNNKKTKDEMFGRIPIQVKGVSNNNFDNKTITYSVEILDLKNYFNEDGAIYFVVYVNNTGNSKIYYKNLLPIIIKREYLDKIKNNQKTITIKLSEFPNDNNKKVEICNNFIINRKKQPKIIINNLKENSENIKKYEISFATFDYPINYILNNPIYIYGLDSENNIKSINNCICQEISNDIKCNIKCNEKIFYNSFKQIVNNEHITINIGKSFKIISYKDTEKIELKFSLNGTLKERIKDMDFFINVITSKILYLNDAKFDLCDINNDDINYLKNNLEYLRNIKKALELSGYNGDLELDDFKNEDSKNLDNLIKLFIYKRTPIFDIKKGTFFFNIIIANVKILLFCKKDNNKVNIYNFFEEYIQTELTDKDGKKFEISQFCILNEEKLSSSNINYDYIKNNVSLIQYSDFYATGLNLLILRMLLLYDKNKNNQLLDCALYCVNYILDNVQNITYLINKFQILKRLNKLGTEEINIINKLVDKNQNNFEILTALYILLDKKEIAKYCLNQIDKTRKEVFMDYPIYNLLKNN